MHQFLVLILFIVGIGFTEFSLHSIVPVTLQLFADPKLDVSDPEVDDRLMNASNELSLLGLAGLSGNSCISHCDFLQVRADIFALHARFCFAVICLSCWLCSWLLRRATGGAPSVFQLTLNTQAQLGKAKFAKFLKTTKVNM